MNFKIYNYLLVLTLSLVCLPVKTWATSDDSVDFSLTYASKYIWRGYDLWNNHGALQPDLSIEISDNIYTGIWGSFATDSACTDAFGDRCKSWNEYDYYLGHFGDFFKDTSFQMDYDISYTYFRFYDQIDSDTQEVGLLIKHPQLIKNIGIPYWGLYYGWPVSGTGHSSYLKLGIESTFNISDQKIKTVLETVWDDGAGSFDTGKGFSHVKVGASSSIKIGRYILKPGVYYQVTTKNVIPSALLEDEFWIELSFKNLF